MSRACSVDLLIWRYLNGNEFELSCEDRTRLTCTGLGPEKANLAQNYGGLPKEVTFAVLGCLRLQLELVKQAKARGTSLRVINMCKSEIHFTAIRG